MKIAFILPSSGISGGVKSTLIIADKLLEKGHQVRIFYKDNKPPFKDRAKNLIIGLLYPACNDTFLKFKGPRIAFTDISECHFFDGEIIIGMGMWASNQVGTLNIKNPKLQYIHGPHLVDKEFSAKTLNMPVPKVVVSPFLKPLVESCGGKVLAIIPNGVDGRVFFPSCEEQKRNGIGTIYSPHTAKDPETVLFVLKYLSGIDPQIGIRVFSASRKPKAMQRNIQYWRLPSVDTIREIYSMSLVWLVLSKYEGFGMPVLEAMACGCVVIATKCGGPEDIIRDGQNGFLVEVGDRDQIIEKTSAVLKDEGLRRRMVYEAMKTAKMFTWDKTAEKLENVLEKLAGPV